MKDKLISSNNNKTKRLCSDTHKTLTHAAIEHVLIKALFTVMNVLISNRRLWQDVSRLWSFLFVLMRQDDLQNIEDKLVFINYMNRLWLILNKSDIKESA